ncbi:hypothetical protein JTB14_002427 [Gonioctena quinquepunctata]|nr:hypothetical protein JTB14_002427 [Gonioctena quinquepunctata]
MLQLCQEVRVLINFIIQEHFLVLHLAIWRNRHSLPIQQFPLLRITAARESHVVLGPLHHDPWRSLQRTIPSYPPTANALPPTFPGLTPPGPAPWIIEPDPLLEQRE